MPGLQHCTKPQGLASRIYPLPSRYGFCRMVGLGGRCRRGCERVGRSAMRIEAKSKAEESLQGFLKKGNELVDTVADLLPDSVPRSTARIAITVVGFALAWFLIQKVISTLLFFLLLGGGAFLYLQSQGGNDRDDNGGGSSGNSGDDDPMDAARKIMDKYK